MATPAAARISPHSAATFPIYAIGSGRQERAEKPAPPSPTPSSHRSNKNTAPGNSSTTSPSATLPMSKPSLAGLSAFLPPRHPVDGSLPTHIASLQSLYQIQVTHNPVVAVHDRF